MGERVAKSASYQNRQGDPASAGHDPHPLERSLRQKVCAQRRGDFVPHRVVLRTARDSLSHNALGFSGD
jgi:hypothetical protein